jgi:chaperonin GroES
MMAVEMPIPQDYNRHITPMSEDTAEHDESLGEIFDQEDPEVEELEDGSAIVRMNDLKRPDEDPDFYQNLAESLQSYDLSDIAMRYLDLIEKDKEAREERDKQYEDGLRRTGLGQDAPGGAQFLGASKVVHPVMAESCVDFAARAIKELFPPDGPVRTKIIGEVSEEKTKRAERKRDYMNWQLTEQIEEYRDEQEQMLTQLPLGGSQYMKLWWDEQKKRPCAEFVPIDNIYLPFSAGNFYTAARVTEVQDITQEEFDLRVDIGLYADLGVFRAPMEPDQSKPEKANDKIEGRKRQGNNVDGVRRVYHIQTWLELEEDNICKGERAPYILMIDENERDVVGLYRNWEDGDETLTKLDHLVEFKFIPWRGAYAIGLPHLIGGLSAALTGALRALLDSAHINTAPTMLKLKGAKISGQSQVIEPTQVSEIEGAPGVDDVRKIAMPVPFNQPSPVLFQLLGYLDSAAKGVITTAEEKIADITSNAPVGTTQALIEQGAAVFSSIHSRLHDSQRRVFKILGRINRWYLEDQRKGEMIADLPIATDDFISNSDVIPVSDPHIFAESQRYAQIQTLAARAQANPDLYNRLAVERRILKQIKIPDINEVLPDPQSVEDMNPALENVAMTLGKPVGAFPRQDHIAHFISHLTYALDPIFGSNPIVAPAYIPACLEHLKQHLTLWYLSMAEGYTSTALGRHFDILKVQPVANEAQKLLSAALQHVHQDGKEQLGAVSQSIQKMLEMMQKMQTNQQAPIDPNIQAQVQGLVQTSMAETQRKAQKDQADAQFKQADMQISIKEKQDKLDADLIKNTENNLTAERIKAAELSSNAAQLQHEQLQTVIDAQNQIQSHLGDQNV